MNNVTTDYTSTKYAVGTLHASSYGVIKILGRHVDNGQFYIEFVDSGSTRFALSSNIKSDQVKDYFTTSVHGVGYLGDFEKVPKSKLHNRLYSLWTNILLRCYGKTFTRSGEVKYTYADVTVCSSWHSYSNFFFQVQEIPGFDSWLREGGLAYNIDKDKSGSRYYSKYTCEFITAKENQDLAHEKQRVSFAPQWVVHANGNAEFVSDYIQFSKEHRIVAYELLKLLRGSQKSLRGIRLLDGAIVYHFSVGEEGFKCTNFIDLANRYNTQTSTFWKLVQGKRGRHKDVMFIRSEILKVNDFEQYE